MMPLPLTSRPASNHLSEAHNGPLPEVALPVQPRVMDRRASRAAAQRRSSLCSS